MTALATSLDTAVLGEALRRQFAAASERARREGRPVVASRTVAAPWALVDDPVAFFARGRRRYGECTYWERPARGVALVGAGVARAIAPTGPRRFQEAAAALRDDRATAVIGSEVSDGAPGGPIYLGGFAFDPDRPATPAWDGYPAGRLVLPRFLLTVRGEVATLTINALVEPGSDPASAVEGTLRDLAALSAPEPPAPNGAARTLATEETPTPDRWKAMVARAAADVRAGRFEKVVLARRLAVHAGAAFDPAAALRSLRAAYPSAYVFAVATNGRCFLGATPELLVRLDGRDVEATCLAGSIARGATAAEDERLARALLASAKDQVEHRIVVRSIQEALAPVCDDVVSEAAPQLLRVANVQHLYTPVRGRLAGDRCVLDLVERLHPTPAVGGYPRDVALAAIREREGFDRGWYAGPVGWVDHNGGGEFAVAIRSALVAGADALLYAGCGIVADSDPDTEYAETHPKLKPMLAGLRTED